ncbi:MAG TPA: pyruvate formate lyase-activating protein [Verrucomicrobia bacterium]|nr:pyruvate formate lyase-activating protein [Verrucomicrobiota bacterium]
MTGRVFEIREFTLQDGPGIRTTVFFKGCPLRCAWCHNPEGQSFAKETLTRRDGTRVACGEDWTPDGLAAELLTNADIMAQSGGGITFSGGEPLAQADFLLALIDALRARPEAADVGLALETSGYCPSATYRRVVQRLDFVYQDLKLADATAFAKWCGGDLDVVRGNVAWLKASGVRHVFRVPCIPGVNDTAADRLAFRAWAHPSPVEFLPYNVAAGAKYAMLGRRYALMPICLDGNRVQAKPRP